MCFTITKPEKIAKKDIVCYKTFYPLNAKAKNDYRSPYYGALYSLGKTYTVKRFGKGYSHFDDTDIINEGIHSYSNLEDTKKWEMCGDEVLVKCIIPKGTKYYYNWENKEYVSLAIKLIKEI